MRFSRQVIVLDAANSDEVAQFWAALLEGAVQRSDEDWYEIEVDGNYPLAIQRVANHVPPQWPDGQPQQIHLDFFVEDIRTEHARALELGATFLKAAGDLDAPTGFQVYADPAGHPFCLCWGWDAWRRKMDGPRTAGAF
ncbi:VOC family protein [Nesterenkonia flava]|uniref:VOC family protein n=1 Tax=Nesterenkonia flava TaxID=469799 RepID=A0ABU1FRB3_9MICC|nr:VOC family protein [Nesterenkonia flava]MDR5711181.1 VOC family protein [Nesterenkonia flava]